MEVTGVHRREDGLGSVTPLLTHIRRAAHLVENLATGGRMSSRVEAGPSAAVETLLAEFNETCGWRVGPDFSLLDGALRINAKSCCL